MVTKNDVERLEEIRQEMFALLEEATNIIRTSGDNVTYQRAKSYWIGHISCGLGGEESNYADRSGNSMHDTIADLMSMDSDDDNSEEDLEARSEAEDSFDKGRKD